MSKKSNQKNEVLEQNLQSQDETSKPKNETEFLNEEETLNEEQSQENEVLNNKEQDEKEENADKEQKVLKDIQCIDIASFEYIGKEPFNHRGFSGKIYTFKQGDIILIPNDERANYLNYKKTLFKSVNLNDLE